MKKFMILLLSLSIMTTLVLLTACDLDNEQSNETRTTDTLSETVTIAETETETETEDAHNKPEIPELDNYQGMTADIPYTLQFYSNGDGTCMVSAIVANLLYEGTYTIEIPETSPDGETVVGISSPKATYNIPRYLTPENFQILCGWIEDYFNKGVEQGVFEQNYADFQFKKFLAYFSLYDETSFAMIEQGYEIYAQFGLCEHGPVCALEPSTTANESIFISQVIEAAAPWYTADWCYTDLLAMKEYADQIGVKDEYLERCLSEHNYHFRNADAIRIPKTLTSLDIECPRCLSHLGLNLMIYDGTMDEFKAIMNMEALTIRPMVVRCTDGELTFDIKGTDYPVLED